MRSMQPDRPSAARARLNSPVTRRAALGGLGLGGLSLALAACSGGDGSTSSSAVQGDELEKIRAAGEIRIGMEGTFQPYGYHDSTGELVGFEKEIADLVAADLGVVGHDVVVTERG